MVRFVKIGAGGNKVIIGIIDLGSNTIRLSIYNCEKDEFKLLTNNKTMAGIILYR